MTGNSEDAVMREFVEMLKSAWQRTGAASLYDSKYSTLYMACTSGDVDTIRRELENGFNIDDRTLFSGDNTLLTTALLANQEHLALWLLERGANPELALINGRTPLITAAGSGCLRVVEALLARGVAIDRQMQNGSTALMYAVGKRQLAVARLLIARGASLTLADNDGWTVRDFAARFGVKMASLS